MRTIFLLICIFFLQNPAKGQEPESIDYGNNPKNGNYVPVNGIKIYYEAYGDGFPLFLLHGNGGSIISSQWKIEYFKKRFKVYVVDSRGHGKSSDDLTKDLNYEDMAEDIAQLMDHLKIEKANFFGQSDGGIIATILAMNHPEKVNRIAVFGINLNPSKKAILPFIGQMVKDTLKHSQNPITVRQHKLLVEHPNIKKKELEKIECPTLIMCGDRDVVKLTHTIEIFENIKNSNLFIMPGGTHGGSWQKPDLFNKVLDDFLNTPFSNKSTIDLILGK